MPTVKVPKIARTFRRLGWAGVWIQGVLAIIPVLMLCYLLFGKAIGSDVRFGVTDYLALLGLAVLAFTTFWSYRYARLGRRIADPDRQPSRAAIIGTLWVGLWAGCIGIAVSVLLMLIEVIRLLILFMKAPQGGVPVIQTQVDNRSAWVSAIDVVSLLAELCTLIGELVVVGFTLWLLFRVVESRVGLEEAGDVPDATT